RSLTEREFRNLDDVGAVARAKMLSFEELAQQVIVVDQVDNVGGRGYAIINGDGKRLGRPVKNREFVRWGRGVWIVVGDDVGVINDVNRDAVVFAPFVLRPDGEAAVTVSVLDGVRRKSFNPW